MTATTVTATPNNLAADGSSRAVITVIPRDGSGLNLGVGADGDAQQDGRRDVCRR